MDTENNASTSFLDKIWVRYGLIAAGISILITVIYYVIDDSLLSDPVFSFLPLLAILGVAILAAISQKKSQEGYIAYSQCVTISLGSFSFALLLSTAFNLLLYFVFDPALLQKLTNSQLKRVAKMVDEGKIPRENYDQMVQQLAEKGPQMFLFNLLIGMVVLIVVALIIFLISSAFIRKEPEIRI